MIKTHKPRGHLWTCPSLFQQTPEIRNISFEDCTPPPAKVIAEDSDDELQPKQRAAKRRRIEKLADEFLNGQPLVISCVRPHPSALKGAIEGNERARTNAKYVLPELEVSDDDGEEWKDVEGVYEVPKNGAKGKQAAVRGVLKQPLPQRGTAVIATETVTEEHATSACKPIRRTVKAVQVMLNPSADAIKQAAALRARRLQPVAADIPKLSHHALVNTIDESDNAEPSESDGLPARSVRNRGKRGSEWLLRRHTTLHELSAEESMDELSRSRLETPSRPSQIQVKDLEESSPALHAPDQHESPEGSTSMMLTELHDNAVVPVKPAGRISIGGYKEHWECLVGTATPGADNGAEEESSLAKRSYHTAPEATDVDLEEASGLDDDDADSQTRLLRKQGINVAPRRSWATTNGAAPALPCEAESHDQPGASLSSSNASALRASLQESAKHAGKPTKATEARRAKSAGQDTGDAALHPDRRRSAPSESQTATTQMEELPPDQRCHMSAFRAYTEVDKKADNGTPFMFRKRTSKGSRADSRETTMAAISTKQRQPMKFQSSEDGLMNGQAHASGTPRLDVSFGNDSFGNRLNLALNDEHLNAVLPVERGTASAIRRAIRDEWKQLDGEEVEISRIEGEPASSQVEGLAEAKRLSFNGALTAAASAEQDANEDVEVPVLEPAQTQWPGTQALLSKAHADFFRSPEKTGPATVDEGADTSEQSRAPSGSAPASAHREPLRTLSQEPIPVPSTQAMVEAWSPWSTVKKPKGNSARVAMGRQPALAKVAEDGSRRRSSLRFSTSTTDSPTAQSMNEPDRHRSSLRFSTSTLDSPTGTGMLSFPVSKGASQSQEKTSFADRTFTPTSIIRKTAASQQSRRSTPSLLNNNAAEATTVFEPSTVVPASAPATLDPSAEMSTGPLMSDFEHAQRSFLFRDDSNVERTMDELDGSVFDLGGFSVIMS